jgi:hypothetical protein
MPSMNLDTADAAELAGLLQFLSQWLARDHGHLACLEDFVGHPAYGISQLHPPTPPRARTPRKPQTPIRLLARLLACTTSAAESANTLMLPPANH